MNAAKIEKLLITALGYNEYLHPEIDKTYEKNRWTYYESFKKSNYYDNAFFKSFTTVREEKMKKIAGIFAWCYEKNEHDVLLDLIKKGYKDVYRYYQQYRRRLDILHFTRYIVNKRRSDTDSASELNVMMYQSVLLYLLYQDGGDVQRLFNSPHGEVALSTIEIMEGDLYYTQNVVAELHESKEFHQEVSSFMKESIGIDTNKISEITLNGIFDIITEKELSDKIESMGLTQQTTDITLAKELQDELFEEGLSRYVGTLTTPLKINGLNYYDLVNVPITKDELLVISYTLAHRNRNNTFTENEMSMLFISFLYLFSVSKQYKCQKEALLNDTEESWYLDVQKREKNVAAKEKTNEERVMKAEKALDAEKRRHIETKNKNKELEKEIERLRAALASGQEDQEELAELREFVYSQKQVEIEYDELTIKEAAHELQNKKVIVCGGHPNMHRRLKEWLPTLETMSTDTLGKNFNFLRNYDVVYFYPNYANHSFYKKIKSAIRNSDTAFAYLPDVDNVGTLLVTMYQHLHDRK